MSKTCERDWLPPARDVVAKFSTENITGIRRLANLLSVSETSIYRWMYSKCRQGGAGGFIPIEHHRPILELARKLGIPLTPSELTGLTEFDPPQVYRRQPNKRSRSSGAPELPLQPAE